MTPTRKILLGSATALVFAFTLGAYTTADRLPFHPEASAHPHKSWPKKEDESKKDAAKETDESKDKSYGSDSSHSDKKDKSYGSGAMAHPHKDHKDKDDKEIRAGQSDSRQCLDRIPAQHGSICHPNGDLRQMSTDQWQTQR